MIMKSTSFKKSLILIILSIAILAGFSDVSATAAANNTPPPTSTPLKKSTGKIFLYGERHGVEVILEKEYELWYDYYHNQGMRHLFIENSYYAAEFLNLWMQSDNDDILDELYNDQAGTAGNVPAANEFYKKIKAECPDTIFHGTDIGHQRSTTGQRYIRYLYNNGLKDTEQYFLAREATKQGRLYYENYDPIYRENMMVENFIREFDKLEDEDIMGIYGGAHTGLTDMDYETKSIPNMANQLYERYGDAIYSESLAWMKAEMDPIRTDILTVAGKDYEALYFGTQDLTGFKDYSYREYWRLENAFDDFKNYPTVGNVLPYSNYPMPIQTGQVFVIDHIKTDGSVLRQYYLSYGNEWNHMPITEEIKIE